MPGNGNKDAAEKAVQLQAALLLAEVRDGCRTSQRAADQIVAGVNELTNSFLDFLKSRVSKNLARRDGYLSIADVNAVVDTLKGQSIFEGVASGKTMELCLRETSSGKGVVLVRLILTYKTIVRKGIPREVPDKYGYIALFSPIGATSQLP